VMVANASAILEITRVFSHESRMGVELVDLDAALELLVSGGHTCDER
jgi:hypothetical protein